MNSENWSKKPQGHIIHWENKESVQLYIVSKGHTHRTMKLNKLASSQFDSKHFLRFDGISTVPFDHKTADENAFLEGIYADIEWSNSYNEDDNRSPEFQSPDWGFLQRPFSETELRKDEASSSRVRERAL